MHRRQLVGLAGATVFGAGCTGRFAMDGNPAGKPVTVTDVTQYDGRPPTYRILADRGMADEDSPAVDLLEQSAAVVRELATAIVGPSYSTWDSPALLADDLHRATVSYGGIRFRPSVLVRDYFSSLPEEWDPPVELAAVRDENGLNLRLTNISRRKITIEYPNDSPFGALVAIAPGDVQPLSHPGYDDHEMITVTDDVVFTDRFASGEVDGVRLDHSGELEATYALPTTSMADHTVTVQLPITVPAEFQTTERILAHWELSGLGE